MDTITIIRAAMFAAIGQQTKISRSGYSLVFVEPQCGRNDLSGDEATAERQALSAGLDLGSVTPEQISAYQQWCASIYQERRINDARIQITRPHREQFGSELAPVNSVRLIDGWGEMVDFASIKMTEFWSSEATNRLGERGAYCHRPDVERIEQFIETLRARHPEFASARVQDNNQGELK